MRVKVMGGDRVCRLFFSEADGLPGFIVDRFEKLVVLQSLTAGSDRLMEHVIEWIQDRLKPDAIVAANDSSMRALEGLQQERKVIHGDVDETVPFQQDDLTLLADPIKGQKTGYFLDQRLNRKLMQTMLRGGESVLDLFCYTGAFGLYALKAGAGHVTFVDGSERALELVKQVVKMNGYESRASYMKADIFEWLKRGRAI